MGVAKDKQTTNLEANIKHLLGLFYNTISCSDGRVNVLFEELANVIYKIPNLE